MFKKISNKITNILVNNNIIELKDFEIYRYGFETLVYFIINISIALLIGIIFNKFVHTVIFLSCYCTLRQFTGGYHARNYLECTLTFSFVYLLIILLPNELICEKHLFRLIIMLIISIIIIYKRAPLEDTNKKLNQSEIRYYKKVAIKLAIFLSTIFILSLIFNFFKSYIIYIYFAIILIAIFLIVGIIKNIFINK